MRVVEMSVQAQANAVTGRGGCCHNKRHTLERKQATQRRGEAQFIYLCETSVGLGIILDYSQRFVGEDAQRSRQGQGFFVSARVHLVIGIAV
jgi:hypothetical protein